MADFGAANTNTFMLGEATVMIGLPADLYKMTPSTHGIGLVKNFQVNSDTGYVELTQGVQNNVVHTTMNKSQVRATFEVYEYTSKNLSYALGLDGSSLTTNTVATTTAASITGSSGTPDVTVDVTSATGLTAGDYIIIQGTQPDEIFVDKIASIASSVLTLTHGIPQALASGAAVKKATGINMASSADQPFLCLAAVAKLADGSPCKFLLPKIRISKGFAAHFGTQNYGNMPFEATVFRPVSTDTFYSEFSTESGRLVMI
jgi:hypothetical protein